MVVDTHIVNQPVEGIDSPIAYPERLLVNRVKGSGLACLELAVRVDLGEGAVIDTSEMDPFVF